MAIHNREEPLENLQQLIDQIDQLATDCDRVSLGDVLDMVGRRSYGPIVLVAGLITLAPLVGDIPGVPTLVGLMVILVLGQAFFQREHLWLPHWLLDRSVASGKVRKALHWSRRPARFVDRLLSPRLQYFTNGPAFYVICAICMAIAAATPVMEFIPFSANFAGAVLTAFGLALIARDGLLALIGILLALATVVFAVVQWG